MHEGPSEACGKCPLHFIFAKAGGGMRHECPHTHPERLDDLKIMYGTGPSALPKMLSEVRDCAPSKLPHAF